jgi:hypothetical protein
MGENERTRNSEFEIIPDSKHLGHHHIFVAAADLTLMVNDEQLQP